MTLYKYLIKINVHTPLFKIAPRCIFGPGRSRPDAPGAVHVLLTERNCSMGLVVKADNSWNRVGAFL